MFQTLQSRLPLELILDGVNTIEQAKEFLNSYIKEFNTKFSLSIDTTKSVFDNQVDIEKMNITKPLMKTVCLFIYTKTDGMVI